ncbi:helix-turn-helix transcriptional regulator [Gallintestinimicrobium propionicum]|uniref:Helix-turn-helix domain-containing protein n=1 Tax=Gallintestinimicrobium propionicum TaxID=2981770 RepID=A0AAE3AVE7_9FIRM|nr:helix-turn-helix transcriptional regulator [Gallintestinimicrobium propionicum]MCC2166807.1 helix-turn-helix domain-containing protein [Gallintestinimicrobium propionicum]
MQDIKQNLANAVREYRTELGLSQERLAENLNLDQRTILNIEAGRGNPKFEVLYPLITYLKIPADRIFYPDNSEQKPNLQKLFTLLSDCTEHEANDLLPMVRYLLELLRKQDNPTL